MTRTYTISAAVDANTPRVLPVNAAGRYLYIRSATKYFDLTIQHKTFRETGTVNEGDTIVPPKEWGGRFNSIELINADTANDLTVTISWGEIIVQGSAANRVPPTRTTCSGLLVLADNGTDTYTGVRDGRRRKAIIVTNWSVASSLQIVNDGNVGSGVFASSSWTAECDSNIKVKNVSGGPVTYSVFEVFYL